MDPYVSPYASDATNERLRRSVMAAQVRGRGTINEVHQRGARRLESRTEAAFEPEFDEESFLGALGSIEAVVEGLCVVGAEGWGERQRLVCERPRSSVRLLLRRTAVLPVLEGVDRATNSLYDPLENLLVMLETFLGKVEAWANKPKYFKQVTIPLIVRTIENSTSEASTAKQLREALDFVGPIDAIYVDSFDPFSHWMEKPILELRALGEFITSILKDGDEIALPGNQEASGGRGSVEMQSAPTLPTSSPYFNTILKSEPATQASIGGHTNTEGATTEHGEGSSAFADLLQAAGQFSDSNVKSPSPSHKPKRESPIDLEDVGSPSYSPPASPSLSFETLLERDEPFPNIPSSILSRPAHFYNPDPAPALPPPGVPTWKIDLNARKGHPIHSLHVGTRELAILSRCLQIVHKATLKGEECARVIIERQRLAVDMQRHYEQWEESCKDLEDNVRIEMMERGIEIEREDEGPENGDGNDHHAWFGASGSARHGDTRDYGRLGPSEGTETWGYRKFDAPASSSLGRRLKTIDEEYDVGIDEEETDTEHPAALQARGTAGFGARARVHFRFDSRSRHGMQSRMDVSSPSSPSSGDDLGHGKGSGTGMKTKSPVETHLEKEEEKEEAGIAGSGSYAQGEHAALEAGDPMELEEAEAEDQGETRGGKEGEHAALETADAMELVEEAEAEVAEEEGEKTREGKDEDRKRGLKSRGGRMLGLYGEEI